MNARHAARPPAVRPLALSTRGRKRLRRANDSPAPERKDVAAYFFARPFGFAARSRTGELNASRQRWSERFKNDGAKFFLGSIRLRGGHEKALLVSARRARPLALRPMRNAQIGRLPAPLRSLTHGSEHQARAIMR